jgi:hypothetical protein
MTKIYIPCLIPFLIHFKGFFYFSFPKIKKTSTIVKSNRCITPTIKTLCCFKTPLSDY